MREITTHKVTGGQAEGLEITVIDGKGAGGANHRYEIAGFDTKTNPSAEGPSRYRSSFSRLVILFQNGPIPEKGVNGVTNEALLAVLIDRMEGFVTGPFNSPDNEAALKHLRAALDCLHRRTRARMEAGVEGTHEKAGDEIPSRAVP